MLILVGHRAELAITLSNAYIQIHIAMYRDDTYISGVGIHFAASTFILTQESPTFVVTM